MDSYQSLACGHLTPVRLRLAQQIRPYVTPSKRLVGINDLNNTMNEIGPERWTAGLKGQLGEEWKKLSGAEDALSQARMQFNRIKNTIAVQNLPPGVASDKDIELVMSGFPSDTSNFETVQAVRPGDAAP